MGCGPSSVAENDEYRDNEAYSHLALDNKQKSDNKASEPPPALVSNDDPYEDPDSISDSNPVRRTSVYEYDTEVKQPAEVMYVEPNPIQSIKGYDVAKPVVHVVPDAVYNTLDKSKQKEEKVYDVNSQEQSMIGDITFEASANDKRSYTIDSNGNNCVDCTLDSKGMFKRYLLESQIRTISGPYSTAQTAGQEEPPDYAPILFDGRECDYQSFTSEVLDRMSQENSDKHDFYDTIQADVDDANVDYVAMVLQKKSEIYEQCSIEASQISIQEEIGKGAYGAVLKATFTRPSGVIDVAVKKSIDKKGDQALIDEGAIMASFQFPNIVKIFGMFQQEGQWLIVLELCSKGSLSELLGDAKTRGMQANRYGIHRLTGYMSDIACAMGYLEKLQFVHRDLAARNVLVDSQDVAKVADFGLSRDCAQTKGEYIMKTDRALPFRWLAPETVTRQVFDRKTEVWSFGVTVWEIFTLGEFPYATIYNENLYKELKNGTRLPQPDHCPNEIYEILMMCWQFNPPLRPRFVDIILRTIEAGAKLEGFSQIRQNVVAKVKSATLGKECMGKECNGDEMPLPPTPRDKETEESSEEAREKSEFNQQMQEVVNGFEVTRKEAENLLARAVRMHNGGSWYLTRPKSNSVQIVSYVHDGKISHMEVTKKENGYTTGKNNTLLGLTLTSAIKKFARMISTKTNTEFQGIIKANLPDINAHSYVNVKNGSKESAYETVATTGYVNTKGVPEQTNTTNQMKTNSIMGKELSEQLRQEHSSEPSVNSYVNVATA